MSNRTYVCVDCRTAKRAMAMAGLAHENRCPICRKETQELHHKWRIPCREDIKEWERLRVMIQETKERWLPRRTSIGMAKIEKIERQMKTLRASKSAVAKSQIKALDFRRREIQKQYRLDIFPLSRIPNLSSKDHAEIRAALAQADAEIKRGECLTLGQVRKALGLDR